MRPVPRGQGSVLSSRAPTIRLLTEDPLSPILLKCDRTAVLSVAVTGIPAPSVRWFIGQRLVRQGPKYGLSTDGRDVHALIIRQVTEELEGGVFVTVSNDNGVNTKLIEVKTFRVFAKMNSSSGTNSKKIRDGRNTPETLPNSKSLVSGDEKVISNKFKDRENRLRAQSAFGLHSSTPPKDPRNSRPFSSTDDVFADDSGPAQPTSALPTENERNEEVRLRPKSKKMESELGRKRAYSWVENFVQEIPSPSIKPGIWEQNRFVSLVPGSIQAVETTAERRFTSDKHQDKRGNRSDGQTEESKDNDRLWRLFGFRIGGSDDGHGRGEDGRLLSWSAGGGPGETHRVTDINHYGTSTQTSPTKDTRRTSEEPLYAIPLKMGQHKSRSSSGLEVFGSGSSARRRSRSSDQSFLFLRTNARTVRCENPLLKNASHQPNAEVGKRLSLPPSAFEPASSSSMVSPDSKDTGVNCLDRNSNWKSFGDIDNLHQVEPGDRRLGDWDGPSGSRLDSLPHRSLPSSDVAGTRSVEQLSTLNGGRRSIDGDGHWSNRQKNDLQRRAFSATVNLRPKSSSGSNRVTKFIMVDIDFDNKKENCTNRKNGRETPDTRHDMTFDRGRSRSKGQLQTEHDQRAKLSRSRSADGSIDYLFQRMLSVDHPGAGFGARQVAEIL